MKKNAVVCNAAASPIMKKSVEVLSEFLLDYTLEYPICVSEEKVLDEEKYRKIFIGTQSNNGYISGLKLSVPDEEEGYCIRVKDDTIVVAGHDDNGVLYGCLDLFNKYVMKFEYPDDDRYHINIFEKKLPDFEYASYPSVKNRGLWTWGHVIYDYRKYIDNMVKLKMNTLTVWNDFVPVNAKEMVEYAHSCGIKIFWGYAWGWDIDCAKCSETDDLNSSYAILKKYEDEYSMLGGDGIYFQSFTEVNTQELGGRNVAEAVTRFVNQTAALFFEKYPEIELQFGLHATSVNKSLRFIENVNPKIRIVWENCGSFPFSYIPSDTEKFDDTMSFLREISALRGDSDKIGFVTKGFTKLNWSEFEHMDGAVFSGVSSKFVKRNRIERKRKIWRYLQAYWLTNADKAYETVKLLSDIKKRDLFITPLVEDGMFEENIMYPVALFSEMLWDCNTPLNKLISDVALRDYVEFS